MKCNRVYLVINPRVGKDTAKLTDVIAVCSAAGWKTDIALKEFGGHTMELATRAAEAGYDLVLGYGGDGTLNQVLNGVVTVEGHQSIVGVIPGGTADVWAGEIGVPVDPVKAALSLVNSEGRKVDIGHVEVESLTLLPSPQAAGGPRPTEGTNGKQDRKTKDRKQEVQPASGGRHHFLLMAGLGIDAAIMGRVSTPLKQKIGAAAVAITAAKELPSDHPFPIEIRSSGSGRGAAVLWKGEALQVVVGNRCTTLRP